MFKILGLVLLLIGLFTPSVHSQVPSTLLSAYAHFTCTNVSQQLIFPQQKRTLLIVTVYSGVTTFFGGTNAVINTGVHIKVDASIPMPGYTGPLSCIVPPATTSVVGVWEFVAP